MMQTARSRLLLLAMAALSLLAAIWAGWVRIGWNWPALQPQLLGAHGPLMVSGFLGTLIALERAVAMRKTWAYAGPVITGFAGILLLSGSPALPAAILLAIGSLGLVAVFILIVRIHPAVFTYTMAGGALMWATGNWLWVFEWSIPRVALWWAAFLIFTIAGERLELGRLLRLTHSQVRLFVLGAGITAAGVLATAYNLDFATRLFGAGLLVLSGWLLRYDIARLTIRQQGLPRFVAACLLTGYVWLGIAGLLGLTYGAMAAGLTYDAFLHTIFIGFVVSMIFGHAPMIFPAVLNLPVQFSLYQYLPLVLLHASLLIRVLGDLAGSPPLRLWGGLLNGIAILLFLLLTMSSLIGNRRQKDGSG